VLVRIRRGPARTLNASVAEADSFLESRTCTVNPEEFGLVGVPATTPFDERIRPAGKLPSMTLHE
jgi:hypothetical protein